MSKLLRRYKSVDSYKDRWRFAWAAYNGGPGWINREIRKCKTIAGCNPYVWTGNVESICFRAAWACKENRAYPKKIIRAMERLW